MSKYAELDQEILRLITNGYVESWSIYRRRRLQALRKAGRIEYIRSNKRWAICTGISISAKQVGFEK